MTTEQIAELRQEAVNIEAGNVDPWAGRFAEAMLRVLDEREALLKAMNAAMDQHGSLDAWCDTLEAAIAKAEAP
jgi:hypothetical protein